MTKENKAMQHRVANVTKENPIKYGEYLATRIEREGITITKLSEELNGNRTTMGHYIKIGKWPVTLKKWIEENEDVLQNTDILLAARKCKSDTEAGEYLEKVVEKKSENNVSPLPTKQHIQDLIEKNSNLESKLQQLKTDEKKSATSEKNSATDDTRESQDTENIEVKEFDWRIKLISFAFWVLVIPVTVTFITACLESFSFPKVPLLYGIDTLLAAAVILSVAIDSLIFLLFSMKKGWPVWVGIILVIANCLAAYWVADRNARIPEVAKYKNELREKKLLKEKLIMDEAEALGAYLSVKWKGNLNPELCESSKMPNCRGPYSTKASTEAKIYQALKQQRMVAGKDLETFMQSKPEVSSIKSTKDLAFHVGWYAILWCLMLVANCLEPLLIAEKKKYLPI